MQKCHFLPTFFITSIWKYSQDLKTDLCLFYVDTSFDRQHFALCSLFSSIFVTPSFFSDSHCSFFTSLCFMLPFKFFSCSLLISLAPWSILQSVPAPSSLLQYLAFPTLPFSCSFNILQDRDASDGWYIPASSLGIVSLSLSSVSMLRFVSPSLVW